MNKDILAMLQTEGIELAEGLSEQEFQKISQEYGIDFPVELKEFYSVALPISEDFYNWRDFSSDNVNSIKEAMKIPFDGIYEFADEVYWCDDWGEEPEEEDKISIIREKLKTAPKLIPIYSHRYMPMIDKANVPILSIYDTDIIYYGENIESYLEIEFGNKEQEDIDFDQIEHVPFWSDLL